jgi:hypothetical protein
MAARGRITLVDLAAAAGIHRTVDDARRALEA